MLNKAFSGGISMSFILAACVATSGCVYERNMGAEDGSGGEGGHETLGGDACGEGGHEVGGVGGGPAGEGGHAVGGGPAGEGGHEEIGGSGGEGGFSGGDECVSCSEYISTAPEGPFCEGSLELYDVLAACVCEGACADVCVDNICTYMYDPTEACKECILGAEGCGVQYANCDNDL